MLSVGGWATHPEERGVIVADKKDTKTDRAGDKPKPMSPEDRKRGAEARGLDPRRGAIENRMRSLPTEVR
jgi:hypothetical protein